MNLCIWKKNHYMKLRLVSVNIMSAFVSVIAHSMTFDQLVVDLFFVFYIVGIFLYKCHYFILWGVPAKLKYNKKHKHLLCLSAATVRKKWSACYTLTNFGLFCSCSSLLSPTLFLSSRMIGFFKILCMHICTQSLQWSIGHCIVNTANEGKKRQLFFRRDTVHTRLLGKKK
jgi:hypothetical protein